MISVIFNKSVDLKYTKTTEDMNNFINQSYRVNWIRKNLNQTYINAYKRRAKKFLD